MLPPLTQEQFDAIISFIFVSGYDVLPGTPFVQFLQENNIRGAADERLKHGTFGVPELTKRRQTGRDYFCKFGDCESIIDNHCCRTSIALHVKRNTPLSPRFPLLSKKPRFQSTYSHSSYLNSFDIIIIQCECIISSLSPYSFLNYTLTPT